ncbi:MAG: sodium/glutamate symporter, partial [Lawsonibacter sp.]
MEKFLSYFGAYTPASAQGIAGFQFEYLTTLGFAALVIFVGRVIVNRAGLLRKFAIPAPVVSGLLFSVAISILKGSGAVALTFD